jgi:hypothetical protein
VVIYRDMTTKTTTVLGIAFLAIAVMLIGGLVVIPALPQQDAEAKCEGFKNNGDPCKPKKLKDNVAFDGMMMPDVQFVKCDGLKKNGDPCKPKKDKL